MIIGFTGPAGCGKSTAAAYLARKHMFARMRFAGPLKNMLRSIGLTEDEIEGPLKETPSALLNGKTPRFAMQTLGSEWGRNCMGDGFWINLAREYASRALDEGGSVVFEDVRFPNEAELITNLGGIVVRIIGNRSVALPGGHSSEGQEVFAHARILNQTTDPIEVFQSRLDGIIDLASTRSGLHLLRCTSLSGSKGC